MTASSPASTGPAGAYFEAQVGAHYLLTMLIGAEPRGLPGTAIDRIEFQRAAEGHPLDDIIVHAHDRQGNNALLEIQVKRSVTFARSDRAFREVVGQVARASQRPRVPVDRHQLAVAIAGASRKIDGAYQEVLTWARRLDSHEAFFNRVGRPGSANDDMRTFVETFRGNLRGSGIPDDKETVWRLLSRFQILPFDYTAPGSAMAWSSLTSAEQAVHIRSVLIESDDWEHRPDEWMSIEVNLGRLVARMFMHDGWSQRPRCYLNPDGVDRLDPLLPALQRLAASGPCFFVALNLIEVDPRPNHLGFIVAAVEAWLQAYPDNSDLWRDQLIGRRICGLIDTIRDHRPSVLSRDKVLRQRIEGLLVSLTSLGVSEAAALERTLSNTNL